jgi:ribonuclease HII
MVFYIGIDDAGRGPVLGPMVLAGILIEDRKEKEISDLGAKDSKLLLPSKRREIGKFLKEKFDFAIQIAAPEEIDSCKNLNHLEAQKMAMVINELAKRTDEKIVAFIDCPSVNIKSWTDYLRGFVIDKERIELRAEHKADAKYPCVSGASIIAKEKREEEIGKLKKKSYVDFGSGYPSDPKTVLFLKENFDNGAFEKIIRHSWSSVKRLKIKGKQKKLF